MDKNDLSLLMGMMLKAVGGEIKITAETQLAFSKGMTNKEILFKEDADKTLTVKLVRKSEIREVEKEN